MDRRWLVAGVIVVTVAGCDRAPELPPEARVTYDTINGVENVTSGSRGTWSAAERWTVAVDSVVTIGALDGPEEDTFGEVAGVVVAGDGRIYVGDAQALEVRVYSPEGEFLFRFGRNGEGPGEFGNISGLRLAPDGIAVVDGQQARVTVFTLDGDVVRTFRLERPYLIFAHDAPMAFDAEGRYLDETVLQMQDGPDSLAVVRYRPDGGVLDTTVAGAQDMDFILVTRDETPIMGLARPFAPRPSLAFGPDGSSYFTSGGEYRVVERSPSGDVVRVIRRGMEPRPVTGAERDSVQAKLLERAQDVGGRLPSDIAIPETKPIIADLQVDALGNLWIQTTPDASWDTLEWWVHDPDGRYLGAVATPRMDVMDIGDDYVAGVTTDDLGVNRVVVARLLKQPSW